MIPNSLSNIGARRFHSLQSEKIWFCLLFIKFISFYLLFLRLILYYMKISNFTNIACRHNYYQNSPVILQISTFAVMKNDRINKNFLYTINGPTQQNKKCRPQATACCLNTAHPQLRITEFSITSS